MIRGSRLLAVDDDEVERRLIQTVFKGRGIALDFACTGPEALARAEEIPPDLILLDVMMPGMDGFEVCRRLRATPDLAEVPILMVTALEDRNSRLQGLEAGADDFLSKPYDVIELRARVQTVLKLNRYRKLVEERQRRQQLEEEARRTSNLEAIGRAARGMAHDFKSYLAAIRIRTELIRQEIENGNPNSRDVDAISQAILEAGHVIDGLLTFAREQEWNIRVVDLAQLVRDLEPSLEAFCVGSVTLETSTMASPLVLRADPVQLRRVIMNLVNNAFDAVATEAAGRIEVRTERAEIDSAGDPQFGNVRPGSYAVLVVEDNGSGIEAENMERLFEPFFTTKSPGQGTGLGLAVVYGIARQCKGFLRVESKPGEGSGFRVFLPLLESADAEPSDQSLSP